jgi:aminoglycoside phosphotransferase (APT) family kinase protein
MRTCASLAIDGLLLSCQHIAGGIPSEERLLDFYCASRGVSRPSPKDWAFYLALSIFRLLAILAGNDKEHGIHAITCYST